jgi:VIT1/CCC1 family predicted Fe2+/Mn2+ transporter
VSTSRRAVLDPVERQSEVVFGLIMALTFTGTISVAEAGGEDVRSALVGAIGCNIAWGIVDALMYVVTSLVTRARAADATLPPGARPGSFVRWDDLRGAVGVFLLVTLATFPVVLPFVFLQPLRRAMRVSNVIALAMLFSAGWSLAGYARLSRWRLATAMLALGTVMVLITIALGG